MYKPPDDPVFGWTARVAVEEILSMDGSGKVVGRAWPEIRAGILSLRPDAWIDLHLARARPAADAMAAGQPFALGRLAPVLVDLGRPCPADAGRGNREP